MLSKVFSVFVSGIAHVRSVLPNKMPGPTTLLVSEGFFDFGTVFSQLDINKFANFVILEIFLSSAGTFWTYYRYVIYLP